MTGIVFSTVEEAQPFLATYERGRFDGLGEGETYHDDHFLVSILGIGKIKAALRTERLLRNHDVTSLIHAGTCTALNEELNIGDMVSVAQVFEGDRIELSAPTYPRMPLSVPFEDLNQVTLVTQDHTVQGATELSYWQRIADISDMSGYAIAYVTATHGKLCQIAKVITGHMGVEDKNLRKTLAAGHKTMGTFLNARIDVLKTL
ncbi:MAG: 5'-methylthioadenosine nucleosidase [Bacteroidota bacterium]|nr:5'-methylthioadenosine nucleosidase [Bacteroidota bacterium]